MTENKPPRRLWRTLRSIMLNLLIILAAILALDWYRAPDSVAIANLPALTSSDGKTFHLDDNRPTLLYIWGDWCIYCRHTSPAIDRLARDDAGEVIGHAYAASLGFCRCAVCEDGKPRASDELPDAAEMPRKERRTRRTHGGNLRLCAEIEHNVDHTRQDVHMLVTVRVRRMNPCRLDAPQLRRELCTYLIEVHRTAQETHGKCRVIVHEDTRLRYERWDLCGRQDGIAIHKRQMDADPELWAACGKLCRIVKCRAAGHDRRRAQNAIRDTALDRAVDKHMPSEIVGIYDNLFQYILPLCFQYRMIFYHSAFLQYFRQKI